MEGARTKGWPPTILINGTTDNITPMDGAEMFTQRMKQAGNICELIRVESGHGATWPLTSPTFEPAFTRAIAFLREQGLMAKE